MTISQTRVLIPEAASHLHKGNDSTVPGPETGSLKGPGTKPGDPGHLLTPQFWAEISTDIGEASTGIFEASSGGCAVWQLVGAFTLRLCFLLCGNGGWLPEGFEWGMGLRLGPLCPQSSTPQDDAEMVVGLARSLEPLKGTEGEPLEELLDEALVQRVALSSAGSLSPMAAMLGAVAAQEVLKVGRGSGRMRLGRVWRSVCVPRVPSTRQRPWRFHRSGEAQPGSQAAWSWQESLH